MVMLNRLRVLACLDLHNSAFQLLTTTVNTVISTYVYSKSIKPAGIHHTSFLLLTFIQLIAMFVVYSNAAQLVAGWKLIKAGNKISNAEEVIILHGKWSFWSGSSSVTGLFWSILVTLIFIVLDVPLNKICVPFVAIVIIRLVVFCGFQKLLKEHEQCQQIPQILDIDMSTQL